MNDAILGLFLLLAAVGVFVQAAAFPTMPDRAIGPGTFPMAIAAIMGFCGAILVLSGLRTRSPALVLASWVRTEGAVRRLAAVPLFVVIYALAAPSVGFPLLVPPLLFALLLTMSVGPLLAILTALAGTAVIWLLFARLLLVPLPLGWLTDVIY